MALSTLNPSSEIIPQDTYMFVLIDRNNRTEEGLRLKENTLYNFKSLTKFKTLCVPPMICRFVEQKIKGYSYDQSTFNGLWIPLLREGKYSKRVIRVCIPAKSRIYYAKKNIIVPEIFQTESLKPFIKFI